MTTAYKTVKSAPAAMAKGVDKLTEGLNAAKKFAAGYKTAAANAVTKEYNIIKQAFVEGSKAYSKTARKTVTLSSNGAGELQKLYDKAASVVKEYKAIKTAGVSDVSKGGVKTDFYVTPSGTAVPSIGYRYMPREANPKQLVRGQSIKSGIQNTLNKAGQALTGGVVQTAGGVALSATGLGAVLGVPIAAHGISDAIQGSIKTFNAITGKKVAEINPMEEVYKFAGRAIGGEKGEAIAKKVFGVVDIELGLVSPTAMCSISWG